MDLDKEGDRKSSIQSVGNSFCNLVQLLMSIFFKEKYEQKATTNDDVQSEKQSIRSLVKFVVSFLIKSIDKHFSSQKNEHQLRQLLSHLKFVVPRLIKLQILLLHQQYLQFLAHRLIKLQIVFLHQQYPQFPAHRFIKLQILLSLYNNNNNSQCYLALNQ